MSDSVRSQIFKKPDLPSLILADTDFFFFVWKVTKYSDKSC